MIDRRKFERVPFDAELTIKEVYNQERTEKEEIPIPIKILDISKGGMGFKAEESLPLHYYFNAKINIGEERVIYTVLHIIRKHTEGNEYHYGCEFTGLADVVAMDIPSSNA